MPPHRAGGKLTSSHTTLIDAVVPIVYTSEPELTRSALVDPGRRKR